MNSTSINTDNSSFELLDKMFIREGLLQSIKQIEKRFLNISNSLSQD
jgi:hypothetical protein